MTQNLVFLCGALRSGTSMTHLMLNAHPEIRNPGEFDFLFDLFAQNGTMPEVSDFYHFLSTDRIFLSKNLRLEPNAKTYKEALTYLIEQLEDGSNVICLNLHRNFDVAYQCFPDAQFIHMIRDPRDVSRSTIGMGWAGNPYFGIKLWLKTERNWKKLSETIASEHIRCDSRNWSKTPTTA